MIEAEKMAEEWLVEKTWQTDQISKPDVLMLIQQVAERTREEDQSKMERELAGIVAIYPWIGLPNFHTGAKWEDEELPINNENKERI